MANIDSCRIVPLRADASRSQHTPGNRAHTACRVQEGWHATMDMCDESNTPLATSRDMLKIRPATLVSTKAADHAHHAATTAAQLIGRSTAYNIDFR